MKLNTLFLMFIFLLSGCGGSDAPSMTTPVDGDEDSIRASARTTERVSVASDGTQGNDYSYAPAAISGDGRYVAFESLAANLVADDTNEVSDVFVHDRDTGITERVSVASDGTQSNSSSYYPAISDEGRYVTFSSTATNLVTGDTNALPDIFVYDRDTGITERVSVSSCDCQSNHTSSNSAISGDGRYVTFESRATNLVDDDTNELVDIFVHDRDTGITERVSVTNDGTQSNNSSSYPAISGNGRYVTFDSLASNLVAGDTNGDFNVYAGHDVFVHDRNTGITERGSVASDGSQGSYNSWSTDISDDGRYVTFSSWATNLVDDDTNGRQDVFVHDRDTGITERVSVASDGTQSYHHSVSPAISGDGRYVTFSSYAADLVAGDTNELEDVFVHDRTTGITERVSVTSDGTQTNSNRDGLEPAVSFWPDISDDGRYVAFPSYAANLVADDTNERSDIFVHSRTDAALVTGGEGIDSP